MSEADERATALLLEHLTADQRETYRRHRYFDVPVPTDRERHHLHFVSPMSRPAAGVIFIASAIIFIYAISFGFASYLTENSVVAPVLLSLAGCCVGVMLFLSFRFTYPKVVRVHMRYSAVRCHSRLTSYCINSDFRWADYTPHEDVALSHLLMLRHDPRRWFAMAGKYSNDCHCF